MALRSTTTETDEAVALKEGNHMLFHIEQVHTPENCPYGKGGSRSLHDASVPGVKVIAIYGSFMEHVIWIIVEANDLAALNKFLLPGMKTCTARITPVSEHPLPGSAPGQPNS